MADNFTWHEVSEKEKQEISQQAKEIMDKFSEELSKIDLTEFEKEQGIERERCKRDEISNSSGKLSKNFSREIMFENAPAKDVGNNFILGEKKKW
ncbi:hypothetical protein K9L16_01715 [Candidatus Pacearchaeota archaeon]|nr:hypothetical protein [Candidatus Pacearchaeota archaeon]